MYLTPINHSDMESFQQGEFKGYATTADLNETTTGYTGDYKGYGPIHEFGPVRDKTSFLAGIKDEIQNYLGFGLIIIVCAVLLINRIIALFKP